MSNMIRNNVRGGRKRKRELKEIEDLSSKQVTFSKRRAGVFKKASELCVLTGAEVTVLCQSFGGRIFAFAHPTAESVVDKYLGEGSSSENNSPACMHIEELKKKYVEITKEMEVERRKSENLIGGKINNENNSNNNMEGGDLVWWQQPFKDLEAEELEKYISSMEELKNKLTMRADDLKLIKSSSSIMFDASRDLNTNEDGLPNEFSANLNLNTEDGRLPDEIFANMNYNFNDDGPPNNEILAMKDPNFNDGPDEDFFTDLELLGDYGNNVMVPNNYGNNVVVPANNYGNTVSEMQFSHNNGNLVVPDEYSNPVDFPYYCGTDGLPDEFISSFNWSS